MSRIPGSVRALGHTSIAVDVPTKDKLRQLAGDRLIVDTVRELVDSAFKEQEQGQGSLAFGGKPHSEASLATMVKDVRDLKSSTLLLSEVVLSFYDLLGFKVAQEVLREVDAELEERWGVDAKVRDIVAKVRASVSKPASEQLTFIRGMSSQK